MEFTSIWFKFWHVNRQLCWYLLFMINQIWHKESLIWQLKFLFVLQAIYTVQALLLYSTVEQLSDYERLVVGDLTLLFFCPQTINLIEMLFGLQSTIYFYSLFYANFTAHLCSRLHPLLLVYQFLYQNNNVNFLKKLGLQDKNSQIVVKKKIFYYQLLLQYFNFIEGLFFKV